MARKARQKISYVLPLPNSPGGHRLGVNSLALDLRGTLYSAGRDGVICAWNVHTDLTPPPDPSVASSGSPTLPRTRPPASTFKTQVQAHTHWVNDLALTSDSEALVSCSSDLTVKLWRPSSKAPPADLGSHTDYVKCVVASGPESRTSGTWVASGGLDRKIFLWDLSGEGEQLCIDVGDGGDKDNPKGSVYSLGIGGGILASGGPESVVRLWDPRSGKPITKFVGHTDLVRSILISQDANIILSASSDSTVKMWSVTGGRCLHTLTMHNDSVWSLHSSHPQLELFHSADRTGLVAKTDIRNITEIEEGICVAVCQENEGVNKLIADGGRGDYIWTATSSSRIHRWLDVDTNAEIVSPKETAGMSPKSPALPTMHSHQHRPSNASIATVVGYPKKSDKPMIPLNSILRLSNTSAFTTHEVRDPDEVTIYSIPQARHASITEAMMGVEDTGDMKPIYEQPDETIEGQNGLIKHVLLNDRRRVLTVDSAGDVLEWDLVKCTVLKKWGKRHIEEVQSEVNTRESVSNWCQVDTRTGRLACVLEENYCFDAEMYADEVELDEKVEFRDDHRINLGKWVLRYLFSHLIDEEIKRDDEYRKNLASAQAARETQRRQNAPSAIILPSPPSGLVEPTTPGTATPRPGLNGLVGAQYPQTPGISIGLATPAATHFPLHLPPMAEEESKDKPGTSGDSDYFTIPSRPKDDETSTTATGSTSGIAGTPSVPATTPAEPAATPAAVAAQPTTPSATSKLSLSKLWSKKPKQTEEKKPEEPKPEEPAEPVKLVEQFDDTLLGVVRRIRKSYDAYTPDRALPDFSIKSAINPSLPSETPVLKHPPEMVLIIQEDSPDSGGMKDVYRGTVGEVGNEADELEKVLPAWVADAILLSKIPMKEVVKVSFVLMPWKDKLANIGDVNDPNNRLNANRMLRARKIVTYIYDRLDPLPAQAGGPGTDFGEERRRPDEWLELMVKDEIIPLNMTLATMKAHVWRTGGDVTVHYRIKGGEEPIERRKVVEVKESEPVEGEEATTVDVAASAVAVPDTVGGEEDKVA
ncbi:hypothetical protein DRE_00790 [Drechslerella stenobrocha 248]|uniref:Uncharacterized protein n=1 Tax=Drechslerella stenobrocha 248 TaxID=1043628 RepID=W7HMX8_9PEZI|nr:hypothetical protein DRE_00790 [Drechslerella stenobrocha 248]